MSNNNFLKSASIHDAWHGCVGSAAELRGSTVTLCAGDKTVPLQRFMMGEKHACAVLAQIPMQHARFGFRQVDDDQAVNDIAERCIDVETRDPASQLEILL